MPGYLGLSHDRMSVVRGPAGAPEADDPNIPRKDMKALRQSKDG
jgi:hypothetical protein